MSTKAVTALVFLIASLLAVVILAGLFQRLLDPTGVAVALCSMLTGIAGGAILRSKSVEKSDKGGDGE